MRWSAILASPRLVARPWRGPLTPESHPRSVVLQLGPDAEGRRATLAVEAGAEGLQVAALAEGPASAVRPAHPEWYYRAHLVAFLNPGHDHASRWLYAVDDSGQVLREAVWIAPGEEPGDHPSRSLPEPPAAEGEFRALADGRFWARLAIPACGGFWPEAMPLGIRLKVGFHEEAIPRPLVWPPQEEWTADLPLTYGDLYTSEPPIAMESVEFEEPAWGGEASRVGLRMAVAHDGPRQGTVEAIAVLPDDGEEAQPPVPWQASNGSSSTVILPVVFPYRAKWASDVRLTARLKLIVRSADGRVCWVGEYPFGFDCGIIVRERYGARGRPLPGRPEPSAPDFLDRQRAYLLARLPHYHRRTTREGAPSDFYRDDVDGGNHVDLMAHDALDGVAAMLAQRFPDWQDALAAAALWACHPCITRHSATWAPMASQAAVGTIPRVNGCFCGDVARLVAALAEKLGECLGIPFKGYTLGLRGHLATLVATPIGRVVLDGMLGHWYPTLDNTRLATLEEMRADDAIVRRVWYCPRAHGHEFYFGVHDQIIQRWREGPLSYPSASQPGPEG